MASSEPLDTSWQKHMSVERIVSHRHRRGALEYLVKPHGLPYAECSWERANLLTDAEALEAIRHYLDAVGISHSSVATIMTPGVANAWLKPLTKISISFRLNWNDTSKRAFR